MKNNFSGANIQTINITEKGDIVEKKYEIKEKDISNDRLIELVEALKSLVESNKIDKAVNPELIESIENIPNSNKPNFKEYIQNFLGNAANLSTLASFGIQISEYFR